MNTLDLHIENHFTTTYSTNHSLLIVHADQTLAPVQYQLVHESDDAPQDLPLPKKPLTFTLEDDHIYYCHMIDNNDLKVCAFSITQQTSQLICCIQLPPNNRLQRDPLSLQAPETLLTKLDGDHLLLALSLEGKTVVDQIYLIDIKQNSYYNLDLKLTDDLSLSDWDFTVSDKVMENFILIKLGCIESTEKKNLLARLGLHGDWFPKEECLFLISVQDIIRSAINCQALQTPLLLSIADATQSIDYVGILGNKAYIIENDLNTQVATLVSINVNGSKEYLDTVSNHQKAIILDDNLFMLSFFDCKLQLQNLTSDSTITISNYNNKKAWPIHISDLHVIVHEYISNVGFQVAIYDANSGEELNAFSNRNGVYFKKGDLLCLY